MTEGFEFTKKRRKEPEVEVRGSPVPGSRYVRDWCAHCGEAMRVSVAQLQCKFNYCRDCGGTDNNLPPSAEEFRRKFGG